MRPLAVLRPEPGNAATRARAHAAGFDAFALPLFAVVPLAWSVPDPAAHDALIVTSANALRFGGAGLAALTGLPVFAVGAQTAAAARAAGFAVAATGAADAAAMLDALLAAGVKRALHLCGHDRTLDVGGPITAILPVYDSAVLDIDRRALARLAGATALLHSTRAACRLAALVDGAGLARAAIALAAFSPAIAVAAETGWAAVAVADRPDDAALFAAACRVASAHSR